MVDTKTAAKDSPVEPSPAPPPKEVRSFNTGRFDVVKGKVKIKIAKTGAIKPVQLGDELNPTDTVITEKGAAAKVVMGDSNELDISSQSEVAVQHYESTPEGKKQALLELVRGKVRAHVKEKYDGKSNYFQVKSRGVVAGVRGTDFVASLNEADGLSKIVTFDGNVEFGQPGPGNTITNSVLVPVGEMSMASNDSPPSAPIALSKDQLEKLDRESDIVKPSEPIAAKEIPQGREGERFTSAESSLKWLKNGNIRYVRRHLRADGDLNKDRLRVASRQHPHAVVLSCSDSSVPPEVVFDQKLGEIYVVRTAGPSVDTNVVGSIEYAVSKLGVKLILVLGHSSCETIREAKEYKPQTSAAVQDSAWAGLMSNIQNQLKGSDIGQSLDQAAWVNASSVADVLKARSPLIHQAVADGELQIHVGFYDLKTGWVQFDHKPSNDHRHGGADGADSGL
jgi:carbonic anhydrase